MTKRFLQAALLASFLALLGLAVFTVPVTARDQALSPSPGPVLCRRSSEAPDMEEAPSKAPAPEERSGPPARVLAFFVCFGLLAAAALFLSRLR